MQKMMLNYLIMQMGLNFLCNLQNCASFPTLKLL